MKSSTKIALLTATLFAASVTSYAATTEENWQDRCLKCHGADGKADTKLGRKLDIRDYTDPAVQAQMTDESMFKATAEGVKNKEGKEVMRGFKDDFTTEEINALVEYIRRLKA